MIGVLLLIAGGMFFSAFFSGSETGFYRATRVRLLLDGRSGDWISRRLLFLANNPALFVATTLVGNNLANYLVARGIVLGIDQLHVPRAQLAELIAPLALSPVVFVFGELLPKQLFFHAPNLMLRRAGPLLLFCTLLFAPLSAILWLLGWGLQRIAGETPLRLRFTLARQELQKVIEEGHQAGILQPPQRRLSQALFNSSGRLLKTIYTPVARVPTVALGAEKADVLRLARRQRVAVIPVTDTDQYTLCGYVRMVDLQLADNHQIKAVLPLPKFHQSTTQIDALVTMHSQKSEMCGVTDAVGKVVGLIYLRDLVDELFRGD